MSIKYYKPTTSSRRKASVICDAVISKKKPEKSLTVKLKKHAGRDNLGKISVRHQGGGCKRKYRIISSLQDKINSQAKVVAIEYDPNRSSFIALIKYEDNQKAYIICPNKIKINQSVKASETGDIVIGNRIKLKNIPTGTIIHDIEIVPGKRSRMVRSAGSFASVAALAQGSGKRNKYVQIKLPSGEIRLIHGECFASIGQVSNPSHSLVRVGKAGRNRLKGIRPTVRGKAMNPCDHPHGGGEGNTSIGLKHPKTPWGKPAMGYKTRKNLRTDKFIVKRRK